MSIATNEHEINLAKTKKNGGLTPVTSDLSIMLLCW